MRALILGNMAQQSVWLGNPQTGLTHTDLALVRADRLPATHLARLHTMRARVFAAMHRTEETRTAVGTADEHLDNSRPDDDPIYLAHYDPAEHNAVAGEALASLATPTGHGTDEATRRLTDSIHGYGPTYTRSKTLAEIRLATHTLATGDLREAAHLAAEALDHADPLRSQRARTNLRHLNQHTTRHTAIPEVADLNDRLTTHLADA